MGLEVCLEALEGAGRGGLKIDWCLRFWGGLEVGGAIYFVCVGGDGREGELREEGKMGRVC